MNEQAEEPKPGTAPTLAFGWWYEMKENKGERAQLARARTLDQIFLIPSFYRLLSQLKGTNWTNRERLALVAGVLAHIREHESGDPLPELLARPRERGSSKPRFSGLRFRRLIQNEQAEEVFEPMIRAVTQAGPKANVNKLANDLYWWNNRTRKDWAYRYYSANTSAE